jgi:hypothetical protein
LGPDEALGAAVALGRPDEGRRALDAQEGELLLEVVGDVLAAVVVPDGEADREPATERAEALPDPLPDRLEGLEPRRPAGGVDADALGRAVVDRHEHRGLALAGEGGGQVRAPHGVDALGGDRAVVAARPARRSRALTGEETVLAHQPQHPPSGGADAGEAQPGPGLPVALAMEAAAGEHGSDRLDQRRIRHRPIRPWPSGSPGGRPPLPVHRGAGGAPDPAHPRETVAATRRG